MLLFVLLFFMTLQK